MPIEGAGSKAGSGNKEGQGFSAKRLFLTAGAAGRKPTLFERVRFQNGMEETEKVKMWQM